MSGTNVHVVIDVVSVMAAYAAITLMMVLCEPKHIGAAFIILTILII